MQDRVERPSLYRIQDLYVSTSDSFFSRFFSTDIQVVQTE